MKRAAFGRLIGVSHQMVTKYVKDGVVVLDVNGLVEVDVSLHNLQGRLRPERYERATAARQATGAVPVSAAPVSAKVHRDAIERDLKLVQLGREVGKLVLAQEVDDAGRRAVLALRESFAATRRESAQRLSASFSIAPECASALAEALSQEFEIAMAAFAREMQREEAEALSRGAGAVPAATAATPAGRLL